VTDHLGHQSYGTKTVSMNGSLMRRRIGAEERSRLSRQGRADLSDTDALECKVRGANGRDLRCVEDIWNVDRNEPLRFHLELTVHDLEPAPLATAVAHEKLFDLGGADTPARIDQATAALAACPTAQLRPVSHDGASRRCADA
jgi:hypothetical protein